MISNNPDLSLLPEIFGRYPEIEAVYLFGSTARGEQGGTSDLDLGIVTASQGQRASRLDILSDLAQAGYCNVDLVFLPSGNIALDHQIVSTHELIYRLQTFDHARFFSLVTRKYLDFMPYIDVQREYFRKRVIHG